MYQRFISDKIKDDLKHYPGVVILGPRQIGKTTLAKELLALDAETLFIDLEKTSDLIRMSDPERFLIQNAHRTVVIGEVQRMPQLFPVMRVEIDRIRRPGRFILLGSSSDDLIKLSTDSLAGRVSYHELHPLNILETSDAEGLWLSGGYPLAYTFYRDFGLEKSREWIANLIKGHIERELGGRKLNIEPYKMELLVRMLAGINGQLLNYSQLAMLNQLTVPTIKKYIELLERAYLLNILRPFSNNTTKRLTRSPKLYLRDVGMLHQLLGNETLSEIESDYNKGFAWEAFVLQQVNSYIKSGVGKYFYRTQAGAEMDLVLTKGNQPIVSFEIKYSNSPRMTRSNTIAREDLNARYNYIVTPGTPRTNIVNNLDIISINDLYTVLQEHNLAIITELHET